VWSCFVLEGGVYKKRKAGYDMSKKTLSDLCYSVPEQDVYGELTENTLRCCVAGTRMMGAVVCDLGSGSGNSLARLVKIIDADVGVGIEVSEHRHEISRILHSGEEKLRFLHQDILKLKNLPEGTTHLFSFDKVFCVDVLSQMKTLCTRCNTLRWIFTTQNSRVHPEEWRLERKILGKMKGSGSRCTVYVFTK
jgi:SAM-dependent methyltransferase